jgi:carbamoyl-phosphate synthase small subunit
MKLRPTPPEPAILALADGSVYRGRAFGARSVGEGEVVFNTSMTGYQEILTDPSYAGQIVTMTYTQIGNVGVNPEDEESAGPVLQGFVVKELFCDPSNFRARGSLDAYLAERGIAGIQGIDTRALVRRLRTAGAQVGVLSTDPAQQDAQALVARARASTGLDDLDLVAGVTCRAPYVWSEGRWAGIAGGVPRPERPGRRLRLVAYDFGIKRNILRMLVEQGFEVTVVPATTSARDALALAPDGIFLSNGPGDPRAVQGVREPVR